MAISPFTLVNGAICELAETRAVSDIVLEISFVDFSIWHDKLTNAMFESL